MAAWGIIGAIVHFIGQAVGKTWDVTRDFISWLFGVMPTPLKFFFFLYMIVFVLATIMPVFLGAGNACDSYGNAYKINFVTLTYETDRLDTLAELCSGNQSVTVTFTEFLRNVANLKEVSTGFWNYLKNIWDEFTLHRQSGIYANTTECIEFYTMANTTSEISARDVVLQEYGTKLNQGGYKNIVHIGCSQNKDGEYFPSLNFYNVDLFSLEMWLLIGIAGLLIPFAFKWYRMIIK